MINNHIYIGIDLSTTNTGIAIVKDKKVIYHSVIAFKPYGYDNMITNYFIMEDALRTTLKWVLEHNYKYNIVSIGIELANFEKSGENYKFNPRLSQRFSQYVGMMRSIIYSLFNKEGIMVNIKTFNANEWFQHLTPNYITMTREERKQFARDKIKAGPNISEDEVDAICIAYLLHKCRDVETIFVENQQKRKVIKKEKKVKLKTKESLTIKKLKLEQEITKYELLAIQRKLTKPQERKIERLKQELLLFKKDNVI